MPVYERGYTHWEPSNRKTFPAWWVIAKRGIAQPFKSRWMIMLLVAAWIPTVIKAVVIWGKLKAGDLIDAFSGGWGSIDPQGFLVYLEQQRRNDVPGDKDNEIFQAIKNHRVTVVSVGGPSGIRTPDQPVMSRLL